MRVILNHLTVYANCAFIDDEGFVREEATGCSFIASKMLAEALFDPPRPSLKETLSTWGQHAVALAPMECESFLVCLIKTAKECLQE